jgi:hypothetical protein
MKQLIIAFLLSFLLSACSGGRTMDVKSPCVSKKDGPCGPRIPVNDWWLNKQSINS